MSGSRLAIARRLIGLVLTLAMPAQQEAFCAGWQSPQDAMACCQRASHGNGPAAAVGCCAAQEQSRQAQSPTPVVAVVQPLPVQLPLPVAAPARVRFESTHRASSTDVRLLASVFQV